MENQYRIISFDVGIKNLAFCVINFNKETKQLENIKNWGLINLKSDLWVPDHNEKKCMATDKKNNICGKASNCWIIKDGKRIEMCRMHSKPYEKEYYPIVKLDTDELNQNVAKLGFEFYPYELKDLKCKCGEKCRKFLTRIGSMELNDVKIAGFCLKCAKIFEKEKSEKLVKISDYLKEDDTKLYNKLYEGLGKLGVEDINEVVIENQPALKNPKMKSIQMFIYSYFFIGGRNGLIKNLEGANFFSATKKLNPTQIVEDLIKKNNPDMGVKDLTEEGGEVSEYQAYKKRKNDSVAIVGEILKDMENWKKYFISHPKKDDLADSFLQGIAQWCMHSSIKLDK